MLVVDASTVVAAAVQGDTDGDWARHLLVSDDLAAPHLVTVEAQQVIRRLVQHGALGADAANQARRDVLGLRLDLRPFEPFAERVWSLRANLSTYDAWYVAVAEGLDAPLATLDRRLAGAPGIDCDVLVPSGHPS